MRIAGSGPYSVAWAVTSRAPVGVSSSPSPVAVDRHARRRAAPWPAAGTGNVPCDIVTVPVPTLRGEATKRVGPEPAQARSRRPRCRRSSRRRPPRGSGPSRRSRAVDRGLGLGQAAEERRPRAPSPRPRAPDAVEDLEDVAQVAVRRATGASAIDVHLGRGEAAARDPRAPRAGSRERQLRELLPQPLDAAGRGPRPPRAACRPRPRSRSRSRRSRLTGRPSPSGSRSAPPRARGGRAPRCP